MDTSEEAGRTTTTERPPTQPVVCYYYDYCGLRNKPVAIGVFAIALEIAVSDACDVFILTPVSFLVVIVVISYAGGLAGDIAMPELCLVRIDRFTLIALSNIHRQLTC